MVILHDADPPTAEGRDSLKANLCEKLQLSRERVEEIFTRLPVILKQDLSFKEAQRYFRVLESLGATAECLSQTPKAESPGSASSAPSTTLSFEGTASDSVEEGNKPESLADNYSLEELQDMLDAELSLAQASATEAESIDSPSIAETPSQGFDLSLSFADRDGEDGAEEAAEPATVEEPAGADPFPELTLAPATEEADDVTDFERRLESSQSIESETEEEDFDFPLSNKESDNKEFENNGLEAEEKKEPEVEFLIDAAEELSKIPADEEVEDETTTSIAFEVETPSEIEAPDSADPEHEDVLLERLKETLPTGDAETVAPKQNRPRQAEPPPAAIQPVAAAVTPYAVTPAAMPTRKIEAASRVTVWAGLAVLSIGLAVLMFKPVLFSGGTEARAGTQFIADPEMIQSLLKQQAEILGTVRGRDSGIGPKDVRELKGADEQSEELTYTATMLTVNKIPAYMDLEVRTPEPPPLTAEELVAGKRRPWVRRVVASGLRVDTRENEDGKKTAIAEDGTTRLVGSARVYLQEREFRDRLVAEVTVLARVTDSGAAEGQFEIRIGNKPTELGALVDRKQVVYVEHLNNHGFQVFIKSPFRAAPIGSEDGVEQGK